MKQNKVINAGWLIKEILEVAKINKFVNYEEDLSLDDIDKILFSLGFPNQRTTLKIEW